MIRAEVHDDEFRTSARFDATRWFEQASDEEILGLAKIGWRGDQEADAIAEFFEGDDVGEPHTVDDVFKLVSVCDFGYEVSVEEEDARRWIQQHRGHLMAEIDV